MKRPGCPARPRSDRQRVQQTGAGALEDGRARDQLPGLPFTGPARDLSPCGSCRSCAPARSDRRTVCRLSPALPGAICAAARPAAPAQAAQQETRRARGSTGAPSARLASPAKQRKSCRISYNTYYTRFNNEKVVESSQKTGPKIVTMHKRPLKGPFVTAGNNK